MVNITSFSDVLSFVQVHGYLMMFIIMIVEGPIIITAASFAASLGYFNIWIVFLLGCLGDVIGDDLAYLFGYYGRRKLVNQYGHLFGIKLSTINKIENHFKRHLGKTIAAFKMTPLAIPVLMVAGASRVPFKKYTFWSIVTLLPKTIFFTSLGYFFGLFANSVLKYYNNIGYYILALIIGVTIIYWLGRLIIANLFKFKDITNNK